MPLTSPHDLCTLVVLDRAAIVDYSADSEQDGRHAFRAATAQVVIARMGTVPTEIVLMEMGTVHAVRIARAVRTVRVVTMPVRKCATTGALVIVFVRIAGRISSATVRTLVT